MTSPNTTKKQYTMTTQALELAQIKRDYYRKESQHFARELKALLKVTKQAFDEACNDNKDQSLIDALDAAIARAEASL